jgi:hypothetical protein
MDRVEIDDAAQFFLSKFTIPQSRHVTVRGVFENVPVHINTSEVSLSNNPLSVSSVMHSEVAASVTAKLKVLLKSWPRLCAALEEQPLGLRMPSGLLYPIETLYISPELILLEEENELTEIVRLGAGEVALKYYSIAQTAHHQRSTWQLDAIDQAIEIQPANPVFLVLKAAIMG